MRRERSDIELDSLIASNSTISISGFTIKCFAGSTCQKLRHASGNRLRNKFVPFADETRDRENGVMSSRHADFATRSRFWTAVCFLWPMRGVQRTEVHFYFSVELAPRMCPVIITSKRGLCVRPAYGFLCDGPNQQITLFFMAYFTQKLIHVDHTYYLKVITCNILFRTLPGPNVIEVR